MAVIKVTMYTVECDNCKTTSGKNSEFSCWNDDAYALEDATDNDWVEHEGKHYCPNCYTMDEDGNITIKEKVNE